MSQSRDPQAPVQVRGGACFGGFMVKFRLVEPNIVVVDEPIPLTELESMGEFIAALLDCEVDAVWLDATAATALGVQFALVARRES